MTQGQHAPADPDQSRIDPAATNGTVNVDVTLTHSQWAARRLAVVIPGEPR